MTKRSATGVFIIGIFATLASPDVLWAMHIADGILPISWVGLWFLVALPFVARGLRDFRVHSQMTPQFKPLISLVGAGVFVISCMPIPVPVAGTCSHMGGTGLASIIIGPTMTILITSVVLTLQALFLAHGGLTTLGANIVSMGIAGAFAGYGVFRLASIFRVPLFIAVFLAGAFSDWVTYAVTSFELAMGLHGADQVKTYLVSIILAFVPTQVPLGFLEGLLSAMAYRFIRLRRPDLLISLQKGTGK